jgi:subtilisin family serine protease
MRTLARAAAAWLCAVTASFALAAGPDNTPAPLPRIVVAFANPPHAGPGSAGATGSRYGGVGYSLGQSAQQLSRRVAAAYQLREVDSWPIQALKMHCVVFEVTNGRPVQEVLAALAKDSRVVLAQPLQEFHTLTSAAVYNDPLYDMQTNLAALGIARAHERAQGAGVRIALIDTGVDASHPDLAGRIVRTHSFIARRAEPASALRHGTAMAGVIVAVANNHIGIVGIAPLARIEVFEACWQLAPESDAAACNTFTLAQAIAAALSSGAPLVNLSIAGPADPLLAALIEAGQKRGVVFVGAAADAASPFPTAIQGVITAAACEGVAVPHALAAPGQHVLTLRPGGEYDFESGTSIAAAEISGVIALLMSASPQHLRSEVLVSLLQQESRPGSTDPPPVDVTSALAQLEGRRGDIAVATGPARRTEGTH